MLKYIHLQTVDSTNTYALNLLRESGNVQALNKTVVVAQEQTAGRGRVNRNFFSPGNTGVYFTAIYAPPAAIDAPAHLTVAAAVAVCRALEKFFGVDPKIKWVNDVYLNQKKVCGILTEGHINSTTQKLEAAVVGIGINLCTKNFPAELSKKAGAVLDGAVGLLNNFGMENAADLPNNAGFDEKQFALTKQNLIEAVCENLYAFYEVAASSNNNSSMPLGFESPLRKDAASMSFGYTNNSAVSTSNGVAMPNGAAMPAASMPCGFSDIIAEYKRRSFLIGRRVKVVPANALTVGASMPLGCGNDSAASTSSNSSMPTGTESPAAYFAQVVDIDGDARLVVRTDGGEERCLDSGEVSLEL